MALRSKKNAASAVTIIAEGSRLEGTLSLAGGVHVDGDFRGEILFAAHACVGTSGRFSGTIQAQEALISGAFEGHIECERLEITDSGLVVGEVVCEQLVIEGGGRFSGRRWKPEAAQTETGEASSADFLPPPPPLDPGGPKKPHSEEVA